MFDPDTHFDVPTGDLLAEIGIDLGAASEVIAEDRASRCPDRETVLRGGPVAVRDTAMPFLASLCGTEMPQPVPPRSSRRPANWR